MATKKDKLIKELLDLTELSSKRKLNSKQIESVKYSIEKRLIFKGRNGYVFLTNATNNGIEMPIKVEMPIRTVKDKRNVVSRVLKINHLV